MVLGSPINANLAAPTAVFVRSSRVFGLPKLATYRKTEAFVVSRKLKAFSFKKKIEILRKVDEDPKKKCTDLAFNSALLLGSEK